MNRDIRTGIAAPPAGDRSVAPRATAPGKVPRRQSRPIVQRKSAAGSPRGGDVRDIAASGFSGGHQTLPHADAIQHSFGGHDVSAGHAYVGGAAREASGAMGAQAYASGDSVAFRSSPDLFTAAHEAAHVVQQRDGVQLSGGVGQAGDTYERHADRVAERVVAGQSAQDLLDGTPGASAPSTQRKAVQFLRAETLGLDNMCWDEPVRVRVTATRLNVRTSPDGSARDNVLGQFEQGAIAPIHGRDGDWLMVEWNGQTAHIHGGYVEPVEVREPESTGAGAADAITADTTASLPSGSDASSSASAGDSAGASASGGGLADYLDFWPFTTLWPVDDQPDDETRPPTVDEQPDARQPDAQPDGQTTTSTTEQDTNPETNPVLRLANDFNNVEVFARGEAPPDHQPATYQTPYFLNSNESDVKWPGRGAVKELTIAPGRPHTGQKVKDAISGRPWVGKGIPAEMQVIAQAIIDNAHDGQTPATIQAYANAGVERAPGRINGKWGVDCSGFTGQLMHEMEGNERSASYESTNAGSFKHDGSRDFTPVQPQDARMGDVISFESTNHVVVVFGKWDVRLPLAGGDTSQTRDAVMLGVSESGASQDSATGRFVRSDRRLFYFPGATRVLGKTNPAGNEHRFANSRTDTLPHWQPELANVAYTGNTAWTDGYTLNCPGDPNGTNIRVRGDNGRFTSTSELVPNGAPNVALREVESDMVRIRVNGQDERNGQSIWAPVRYVARSGQGYSIPTGGQPDSIDGNPKLYSLVRNPALDDPESAEPAPEE